MDPNPVRFRLTENSDVELGGTFVFRRADVTSEPLVVFTLNEGYRPAREVAFNQPCETGRTIVTIRPDGGVVARADVGWIELDGILFAAA